MSIETISSRANAPAIVPEFRTDERTVALHEAVALTGLIDSFHASGHANLPTLPQRMDFILGNPDQRSLTVLEAQIVDNSHEEVRQQSERVVRKVAAAATRFGYVMRPETSWPRTSILIEPESDHENSLLKEGRLVSITKPQAKLHSSGDYMRLWERLFVYVSQEATQGDEKKFLDWPGVEPLYASYFIARTNEDYDPGVDGESVAQPHRLTGYHQ